MRIMEVYIRLKFVMDRLLYFSFLLYMVVKCLVVVNMVILDYCLNCCKLYVFFIFKLCLWLIYCMLFAHSTNVCSSDYIAINGVHF